MTSPVQRDSVAKKIIAGTFKILFPSAAGRVQGIEDVVGAIQNLDAQSLEGRALPRRLADAADRIADRLERIETIEYAGLDEAERRLAVEGVELALTQLDPTRSKIIQGAITTEQLRAALGPVAERHWRSADLGETALSYGRLYLTEAAAYVSALVRGLPGFDSDVAWATYVATRKIDDMLTRGITSVVLPKFRPGLAEEVSRFEAGYRSDVTSTYRDTDLFGLNLPIELRRHPVDVAYIRLRAAVPTSAAPATEASPTVDAALGRIASARSREHGNREHGSREHGSREQGAPEQGARVLLTGAAGSGKTTITQWLAINTAQRRLPESMAAWSDCVPFVAQLRYAFGANREPGYEDLIKAAAWRGSDIPGSWVRECLDRGEAVVVFDGLDELSYADKGRAYLWIEKLLRRHPRTNVIVTSRPDNLDQRWFDRRGFDRLQLLPMSETEAQECIDRWFEALISGTAHPADAADYRARHHQLVFDFRNRPTVRDLSETPLLCAMLCAFYAHNLSDAAPQSRADLYERVVSALIHFRDHVREVDRRSENTLTYKQKLVLLEAIAKHMTVTSTTTIRIEPLHLLREQEVVQRGDPADFEVRATTARDIVAEQLTGMVSVSVPAEEALAHLLSRSVVFQRVGHDQAQFVHRSIQEFLTGWAYADGPIEDLVPRARLPEWRRVIVFAAGAPVQQRAVSALIAGILTVAETSTENRRDLLLLAAECLTAAGRVSATVAELANRMIQEVLPPRSVEEARSLTGLGEELLGWLDGHFDRPPEVVGACIAAAARVGGPAAMKLLGRYAASPVGSAVVPHFLSVWDRFDAEPYAREVLARLPIGPHEVVVRTGQQLAALPHVTSARSVRIAVDPDLADLTCVAGLEHLTQLDCSGLVGLRSTAGLAGARELRRLNLSGCAGLTDAAELVRLPKLAELYLAGCTALPAAEVEALAGGSAPHAVLAGSSAPHAAPGDGSAPHTTLAGGSALRVLVLDGCTQFHSFDWIGRFPGLLTLSLDRCDVPDLEFCRTLGSLRTLRVRTAAGLRDLGGLAGCGDLRRLSLTLGGFPRSALPVSPSLQEVEVVGPLWLADLSGLAAATGLRRLVVDGLVDLTDLAQLPPLAALTQLVLPNCTGLTGASGAFVGFPALEVLDLSGSRLTDTDFVAALPRLRRLYLNGCTNLVDISAVAELPAIEYLGIADGVVGVDQDMVDEVKARARRPLTIDHDLFPDPFDVSDYISA